MVNGLLGSLPVGVRMFVLSPKCTSRRTVRGDTEIQGNVVMHGEGRSFNRTKWSQSESIDNVKDDEVHHEEPKGDTSVNVPDVWKCLDAVKPELDDIDRLVASNMKRVQKAFRKHKVGPHHFQGSTGYGHGDIGRSTLDEIMAEIMGAESAAVRIQFVSGTHAIAAGLFSYLRPGDELLAIAGSPYDTLEEVIGTRGMDNAGSLIDFGVKYRELGLTATGSVDFGALETAIKPSAYFDTSNIYR